VNIDRRPRALTIAFAAIFATAFFFAGYAVRTATTAMAAVPIATPTPLDGNPSGHRLELPKSFVPHAQTAARKSCLKEVAENPIAVRYVTAAPSGTPVLKMPTCPKNNTCVPFSWRNMQLTTEWPDHTSPTETVDIYGTLDTQ
jgi:hypothetical protein